MKPEFPDDDVTRSISGRKAALFACIAALLVVSPVIIDAAIAATAPDDEFTYRSSELKGYGRTIEVIQGPDVREAFRGIDCYPTRDRECYLERRLLGENVTVERTRGSGGEPDPRYAYHHGRLYERTYVENASNRTYGMEPVSGKEVLADVAIPVEESPENATIRRIIEGDQVTVDHQIAHPADPDKEYNHAHQSQVYEYEGSYYALALVSVHTYPGPRAGAPLSALGLGLPVTGLLGSVLFLRRYDRIEL